MTKDQGSDWVPPACTLPTAERPLRLAEFDDLFASVRQSTRLKPTQLELVLPHAAEATGRDLAGRERACCSFFTFEFEPAGLQTAMRIGVPPAHVDVLDALEARVAAASREIAFHAEKCDSKSSGECNFGARAGE